MEDFIKKVSQFIKDKIGYNFLIAIIFYILEIIFPKQKNLVIVGPQRSRIYADNCRFFFELCQKNKDLKVYLLTKNKKLYDYLIAKGFSQVLFAYSIKGLITYLKAGSVCISYSKYDIHPYYPVPLRKSFINFWHGTPIKRVKYLNRKSNSKNNNSLKFCKYHIASSEFGKYQMATQFKVHIDNIWLTGQPRNDKLKIKNTELLLKYPFLDKKIILYAPTYREYAPIKYFPFEDFESLELDNLLEREDAYILVRSHLEETLFAGTSSDKELNMGGRIIVADTDKFPSVQELLTFTDILITDYSSIYFDFLLLEKPILFFPYDYERYETYTGFNVDYFANTPGPKIYNFKDFIDWLSKYLENPSLDSSKRNIIRDKYNLYKDGNSSLRIVEQIKQNILS